MCSLVKTICSSVSVHSHGYVGSNGRMILTSTLLREDGTSQAISIAPGIFLAGAFEELATNSRV